MAYPVIAASTVMDSAASLMNDTARSVYSYTVQIPYLNMALRDMQELYELSDVPVTQETSAVIECPANTSEVGFEPDMPVVGTPYLPDNLVEPLILWERAHGINPYVPMTKWDFIPLTSAGAQINQFVGWVWESNKLKFLPTNQANDIKMNYVKFLFEPVTDEDDDISVINAQTFLEFRTAALLARFVEENKARADDLDAGAILALDRVNGIQAKGRQAVTTRHRPFRSSYKRRGYI